MKCHTLSCTNDAQPGSTFCEYCKPGKSKKASGKGSPAGDAAVPPITPPVPSQMHAEIEASKLHELNALISSLADKVRVDMGEHGWVIKAVDSAHVAMVSVEIDPSAFSKYASEETSMLLDLDRFKTMLGHIGKKGSVELDLISNVLHVRSGALKWKMRLGDPEEQVIKVPNIINEHVATVPRDELIKVAKVTDSLAYHVGLHLQDDMLVFKATGQTDDAEVRVHVEGVKGSARVMLPADYFGNCVKVLPQEQVGMSLATDRPLVIMINGWAGALTGRYLLAPMIESDDEPDENHEDDGGES